MAKDPHRLHGHNVVSGSDLDEKFAPEPDDDVNNGHRFRVRLRHAIVLFLLLGVLSASVAAVVAFQKGYFGTAAPEASPTRTSVCQDTLGHYLDPKKVKVNVYNASNVPGLATSVATELRNRGFVVDAVGNRDSRFLGAVAVVSGPQGHDAAFTLQRHLPGSDFVQDERTDGSVDVILFERFKELAPIDKVADGEGPLQCPRSEPQASVTATASTGK